MRELVFVATGMMVHLLILPHQHLVGTLQHGHGQAPQDGQQHPPPGDLHSQQLVGIQQHGTQVPDLHQQGIQLLQDLPQQGIQLLQDLQLQIGTQLQQQDQQLLVQEEHVLMDG